MPQAQPLYLYGLCFIVKNRVVPFFEKKLPPLGHVWFRPNYTILGTCGIYVFQSWINANGTALTPTNSSGLVRTSDGSFLSVLDERGPTGTYYQIGQTGYNYIRASGVSCNGCSFSTGGCTVTTVSPSKLEVVKF
jgi:hypothetical protein